MLAAEKLLSIIKNKQGFAEVTGRGLPPSVLFLRFLGDDDDERERCDIGQGEQD